MIADQRDDGAVPHVSPDPTRLHPKDYPGFCGSTGWGDAIAIVPWQLYLHYGDSAILSEALPAMVKWVDFVWSISDGPIVSPPRQWGGRGFTFGDWLQPSGPSAKPLPTIGDDAAATIYLYITSSLVGRIARLVGEPAIAARMDDMAAKVKAAFATEFVTPPVRDDQPPTPSPSFTTSSRRTGAQRPGSISSRRSCAPTAASARGSSVPPPYCRRWSRSVSRASRPTSSSRRTCRAGSTR